MKLASRTWGRPDGRPSVLLLHGATGWSQTWWRVAPAIVDAGYHVLALDLPAHGENPSSGRPISLAGGADDIRETVHDRLGSERVGVVWGFSLGALLATELVNHAPGFAERAVLVDPPVGQAAPSQVEAAVTSWREESRMAREEPEALFRRLRDQYTGWDARDVEETVGSMAATDVEAVGAWARESIEHDGIERLAALRIPALLVLAAEERGSAVAGADRRRLLSRLPSNLEVVRIDAGHVVHRDQFDAYMRATLGWLASRSQRFS